MQARNIKEKTWQTRHEPGSRGDPEPPPSLEAAAAHHLDWDLRCVCRAHCPSKEPCQALLLSGHPRCPALPFPLRISLPSPPLFSLHPHHHSISTSLVSSSPSLMSYLQPFTHYYVISISPLFFLKLVFFVNKQRALPSLLSVNISSKSQALIVFPLSP